MTTTRPQTHRDASSSSFRFVFRRARFVPFPVPLRGMSPRPLLPTQYPPTPALNTLLPLCSQADELSANLAQPDREVRERGSEELRDSEEENSSYTADVRL